MKALISLKWGDIGPKLLLRTNWWHKLMVSYSLSNSGKIYNLGWPWGSLCTVSKYVHSGVVSYLFLVSHSICF